MAPTITTTTVIAKLLLSLMSTTAAYANEIADISTLSYSSASLVDDSQTALREKGLFILEQVPGLVEARRVGVNHLLANYHQRTPRFAYPSRAKYGWREVRLTDGTRRATLAAHTTDGKRSDVLQLGASRTNASREVNRLRDIIAAASSKVTGERLVREHHREHFHMFRPSDSEARHPRADFKRATLEMHIDAGALLVMMAPFVAISKKSSPRSHEMIESTSRTTSPFLVYRDRVAGEERHVRRDTLPSNSLLFMTGHDATRWLTGNVRGLEHATRRDDAQFQRWIRVWYGRMIMFRKRESRSIDCGPGKKLLDAGRCDEGTLYCWHSCMTITADAATCGVSANTSLAC
eukprot:gene33106-42325_t